MPQGQTRLLYIGSAAIQRFCTDNPINWLDSRLANGAGNVLTPTPAVGLFYDLLSSNERLFTQEDYWQYATEIWRDWLRNQKTDVQVGLRARLFRNFYPSCVDTIHSWALLSESGRFDYCILDPVRDAVAKSDITLWTLEGRSIGVALYVASEQSRNWTAYKRTHRGEVHNVVDVTLPMTRPRNPGNKRWYEVDDFAPVFAALDMAYHSTATPQPQYSDGQSTMFGRGNAYDLGY